MHAGPLGVKKKTTVRCHWMIEDVEHMDSSSFFVHHGLKLKHCAQFLLQVMG